MPKHPLIGKYFHSYNGKLLHRQGKVLAEANGNLLVQLYEWFVGAPSEQVLVDPASMKSWKFYDDRDSWLAAYEVYEARVSPSAPATLTAGKGAENA